MSELTRRETLQCLLATGALGFVPGPLLAAGLARTRAPRARSVIQIWMWGGPAHLDTFDPKPEAGPDYCGPLDSPIETNVPGIRIGQLLPLLAQQADKYAIIRSMTHGVNGHETASYLIQTGHAPGRTVYPNLGAVVAKFRGYEAGYTGAVPPYIVLTRGQGRFSEAGLLGPDFKPFATGGDPNGQRFAVEGIINKDLSEERQRARKQLAQKLDTMGMTMGDDEALARYDAASRGAEDLMYGEARELFDLSREDDQLRTAYGRNTFGQSCLAARRLIEYGVPFVTINYRGWDTHKQHFQIMNNQLPELDRGMATLLEDLASRGLLDQTIVWWGGEFGRGPKIQKEAPWNGGRSHYGSCFSHLVAGGGFSGGQVVGASDATGEHVAARPVSPRNLLASIYQLMGIDPLGALPNPRQLPLTIFPDEPDPWDGAGPLHEIMPT